MPSSEQEAPLVKVETENFVQLMTLNRPKALNAFNNALFDALAEAFLAAADDDRVRVVVLTGNGRAFSPASPRGVGVACGALVDSPNASAHGTGGSIREPSL